MAAPIRPVLAALWDATADYDERDVAMRDGITKAHGLMDSHEYSEALHVIFETVSLCPCMAPSDSAAATSNGMARHGKDKACHISQFIAALQSEDPKHPKALCQLASQPCSCGYSWPSCPRILHAVALDALAECLNKADQHVNALSTALGTIRLDPACAVGYCRAARIIHQLLIAPKHSPAARAMSGLLKVASLPSADALRELLRSLVRTGLYNTSRSRARPRGPYYFILQDIAHRLKIKEARRDPVEWFPAEVLTLIFSHLDITSLIKCLSVSKQWNRQVRCDSVLWEDLRLNRPRNPGRFLAKFLQQHQEIRTFVVYESSSFSLNGSKISTIFYGLPRLQRLYLTALPRPSELPGLDFQLRQAPGASLTQLTLVYFYNQRPVKKLLDLTCNTLEVLDLVGTDFEVNNTLGSVFLPRLRKLRVTLGHLTKSHHQRGVIEMKPIVKATPRLEQFFLDGFTIQWFAEDDDELLRLNEDDAAATCKDGLWPSLNTLVLGPGVVLSVNGVPPTWEEVGALPPLTSNMRSIEILSRDPAVAHNVLFAVDWVPRHNNPDGPFPVTPMPNLEVFRCTTQLLTRGSLRQILEPAAKSGALKVLELAAEPFLSFPDEEHQFVPFQPKVHLDYAVSPNLHTLGLRNFNCLRHPDDPWNPPGLFDGQPFIDWLDSFPSLHTVAVYPGLWAGVDEFIMKLIRHHRVQVIHQDLLRGVAWDQAVELAKWCEVQLNHTPHFMHAGWPLIED
ncbi:818364c0-cff4-44bf-b55e-63408245de96 [Thermothielavioides terrestris]|uniref:818364c0-cff4-44bf-b55e-63408245de96 n=1 Tax=Thermothielavioides terrestris TaxID=2587410 RepID=A0A446BIB3_9PEZI|nr:818364c0-cff4-44bf-b55e-63408245de96 [Thermothielavioides terrestris]